MGLWVSQPQVADLHTKQCRAVHSRPPHTLGILGGQQNAPATQHWNHLYLVLYQLCTLYRVKCLEEKMLVYRDYQEQSKLENILARVGRAFPLSANNWTADKQHYWSQFGKWLDTEWGILFIYIYYQHVQGVPKKCPIAIFSFNLFQRCDCTFSHVFRNQNFEPVPSKHFKHAHSEY